MNCKDTLREINKFGSNVSKETLAHIRECTSCSRIYNLELGIEKTIMETSKILPPEGFKTAVIKSIESRKRKRAAIPFLSYALKFSAVAGIFIFGLWLGMQTANGTNEDVSISDTDVYALNTSPAYPDNLGDIYFAALEGTQNEN